MTETTQIDFSKPCSDLTLEYCSIDDEEYHRVNSPYLDRFNDIRSVYDRKYYPLVKDIYQIDDFENVYYGKCHYRPCVNTVLSNTGHKCAVKAFDVGNENKVSWPDKIACKQKLQSFDWTIYDVCKKLGCFPEHGTPYEQFSNARAFVKRANEDPRAQNLTKRYRNIPIGKQHLLDKAYEKQVNLLYKDNKTFVTREQLMPNTIVKHQIHKEHDDYHWRTVERPTHVDLSLRSFPVFKNRSINMLYHHSGNVSYIGAGPHWIKVQHYDPEMDPKFYDVLNLREWIGPFNHNVGFTVQPNKPNWYFSVFASPNASFFEPVTIENHEIVINYDYYPYRKIMELLNTRQLPRKLFRSIRHYLRTNSDKRLEKFLNNTLDYDKDFYIDCDDSPQYFFDRLHVQDRLDDNVQTLLNANQYATPNTKCVYDQDLTDAYNHFLGGYEYQRIAHAYEISQFQIIVDEDGDTSPVSHRDNPFDIIVEDHYGKENLTIGHKPRPVPKQKPKICREEEFQILRKKPFAYGAFVNNSFVKGPFASDRLAYGSFVDGSFVHGPLINGPSINGSFVDGSLINGSFANGTSGNQNYSQNKFTATRLVCRPQKGCFCTEDGIDYDCDCEPVETLGCDPEDNCADIPDFKQTIEDKKKDVFDDAINCACDADSQTDPVCDYVCSFNGNQSLANGTSEEIIDDDSLFLNAQNTFFDLYNSISNIQISFSIPAEISNYFQNISFGNRTFTPSLLGFGMTWDDLPETNATNITETAHVPRRISMMARRQAKYFRNRDVNISSDEDNFRLRSILKNGTFNNNGLKYFIADGNILRQGNSGRPEIIMKAASKDFTRLAWDADINSVADRADLFYYINKDNKRIGNYLYSIRDNVVREPYFELLDGKAVGMRRKREIRKAQAESDSIYEYDYVIYLQDNELVYDRKFLHKEFLRMDINATNHSLFTNVKALTDDQVIMNGKSFVLDGDHVRVSDLSDIPLELEPFDENAMERVRPLLKDGKYVSENGTYYLNTYNKIIAPIETPVSLDTLCTKASDDMRHVYGSLFFEANPSLDYANCKDSVWWPDEPYVGIATKYSTDFTYMKALRVTKGNMSLTSYKRPVSPEQVRGYFSEVEIEPVHQAPNISASVVLGVLAIALIGWSCLKSLFKKTKEQREKGKDDPIEDDDVDIDDDVDPIDDDDDLDNLLDLFAPLELADLVDQDLIEPTPTKQVPEQTNLKAPTKKVPIGPAPKQANLKAPIDPKVSTKKVPIGPAPKQTNLKVPIEPTKKVPIGPAPKQANLKAPIKQVPEQTNLKAPIKQVPIGPAPKQANLKAPIDPTKKVPIGPAPKQANLKAPIEQANLKAPKTKKRKQIIRYVRIVRGKRKNPKKKKSKKDLPAQPKTGNLKDLH